MIAQAQHSSFVTNGIYQKYLDSLIQGNSTHCMKIVEQLLAQQVDIRELYLGLFQESLYEVGRLWERNKISVAREHLATAITDRAMNIVYPRLFLNPQFKRKKALVSCAANEYHQIGGKMIADILELNHWDTHFLGANTPVDHLLKHIQEESVALVGLSMSVYFNIPSLLVTIESLSNSHPNVKIIVGGQGFRSGGVNKLAPFPNVTYCAGVTEMESTVGHGKL